MPRRRYVKRAPRAARRFKRRALRRYRRSIRLRRSPFKTVGFPPTLWRRLRYCGALRISNHTSNVIDAGLNSAWYFRVNGLYDPDQTGLGGQPSCFDQHMLFYQHYWCPKAVIRVRACNLDAAEGKVITLRIVRATGETTTFCDEKERGAYSINLGPFGAGNANKNMVMTYSQGKFFGKRMQDEIFRGDDTSNPAEQAFFLIGVANTNLGSVAVGEVQFQVTIDYYAKFFEPKSVIPS